MLGVRGRLWPLFRKQIEGGAWGGPSSDKDREQCRQLQASGGAVGHQPPRLRPQSREQGGPQRTTELSAIRQEGDPIIQRPGGAGECGRGAMHYYAATTCTEGHA